MHNQMIVVVETTTNIDFIHSCLIKEVNEDEIIKHQLEMIPQDVKNGSWITREGEEGEEHNVLYIAKSPEDYHAVKILLGIRELIKHLEDEAHEYRTNAPFAEDFFAGNVDAFDKMGDEVKKSALRLQAAVLQMLPNLIAKCVANDGSREAILKLVDLKDAIDNAKKDHVCLDILNMIIAANDKGYPTVELTEMSKAFKEANFEVDDKVSRQCIIMRARALEITMQGYVPKQYRTAKEAPALRIKIVPANYKELKKLSC